MKQNSKYNKRLRQIWTLQTLRVCTLTRSTQMPQEDVTSYDQTHWVPPKRLTQRPISTSSWVVYISLRQDPMCGTILRRTSRLKIIPGPPIQKFSPGSRANLPSSSVVPRPVWPRYSGLLLLSERRNNSNFSPTGSRVIRENYIKRNRTSNNSLPFILVLHGE